MAELRCLISTLDSRPRAKQTVDTAIVVCASPSLVIVPFACELLAAWRKFSLAHCLAEHLKRSNVCPLCRKSVSTAHASFLLRRLAQKARGDIVRFSKDMQVEEDLTTTVLKFPVGATEKRRYS